MNLSLKYTLFAQSISCIIFLMHVASMQHYTVKESLEKKKKVLMHLHTQTATT